MPMPSPPAPLRSPPSGQWATGVKRASAWLSGAHSGHLPARVQRDLEAQQRLNEILVGWVQAALVLTFALLYAFSRKTFVADMTFQPVPWALGVYALLPQYACGSYTVANSGKRCACARWWLT